MTAEVPCIECLQNSLGKGVKVYKPFASDRVVYARGMYLEHSAATPDGGDSAMCATDTKNPLQDNLAVLHEAFAQEMGTESWRTWH